MSCPAGFVADPKDPNRCVLQPVTIPDHIDPIDIPPPVTHDCPDGSTWKQNGPKGPGCYIQECPPGGIPGSPSCPPPPPDKDTTTPETPATGDCPPGMHWNKNAKQCRPGSAPTGGGGGGTGASAFGSSIAAVPANVGGAVEDQIYQHVLDLLNGKSDPYSDERLGRLKGSLFSAAQGRARSDQDQLDEDLISSGMFRGGDRIKGRAAIRRGASRDYTAGVGQLLNAQETTRYQARLDALDRAQKWLDAKRQYLLASEDNQIKLKIGLAQIQLGYAKIASEEKQLQLQLSARGGGGGGPSDEDLLRQIINGG
jgi:hypothetical protein